MRICSASNACALSATVGGFILLGLAGCDKLTPNGQSGTMTLLRAGSEKVCVAPDVQKAVRAIIIPPTIQGVAGNPTLADQLAAISAVAIAFNLTTLQGFDKSVSRASCNADVRISGRDNQTASFNVDFEVSPSADDPTTFIATARADEAKLYARNLILSTMSDATAARQAKAQSTEAEQARSRVLAVATSEWLLGSWLPVGLKPDGCATGFAFVFNKHNDFSAYQVVGSWTLTEDELHVEGKGADGALNITGRITAADPMSFTFLGKDGTTNVFRRCADDRPTEIETMNSIEGLDVMTPEEAARSLSQR